jgi:hypothetical protein
MTTTNMLRALAIGTAIGLALPAAGNALTPLPITHSCSADGLAQFECGNPQTIPDCEVTCVGKASCFDAQCDIIYVEGPFGRTDEEVAYFPIGPVCACVGGWSRLDSIAHVSCLAEMFRRTDTHRAKTAKALSRCEVGVLTGRVTLPAGGTCADDDARTAASIAASRAQATASIARKCPANVMAELYGAEGEAGQVFVDGLLRQAEGHAAAGIGLALRPAVVAP